MLKEYQLRKLQNSYEVTLHYKGVKVRIAFTGGNVYNGTMPKFRTDNLFKMKALESSELFKNKEVVLSRTIGEAPRQAAQPRKKVQKPAVRKPAPVVQPPKDEDPPVVDVVEDAPAEDPVDVVEDAPAEDPVDAGKGGDGSQGMNFNSVDEAILYIAQNFQQEVTTEKEAREVLKANGITPHIKKG